MYGTPMKNVSNCLWDQNAAVHGIPKCNNVVQFSNVIVQLLKCGTSTFKCGTSTFKVSSFETFCATFCLYIGCTVPDRFQNHCNQEAMNIVPVSTDLRRK